MSAKRNRRTAKRTWMRSNATIRRFKRFFKNSVRDPNPFSELRNHNYNDFSEGLSDLEITPNSMSSTYNTYPSISPHNPTVAKNRRLCNFCRQRKLFGRSHPHNLEKDLYFCDSCEDQPICLNCRKEICVHCKKPTNVNKELMSVPTQQAKHSSSDAKSPSSHWQLGTHLEPNVKVISTGISQYTETDEESDPDHKPFSFNIPESSVFHPSRTSVDRRLSVSVKNGEIVVKPAEDLKRFTNERLSKLAKNYGVLRSRRAIAPAENKVETNQLTLPSIRPETKKLMDFAKQLEKQEMDLNRYTAYSTWQANRAKNPAATRISEENALTQLTQLGAFKKQLNLDKLNFDDEDDDTHSYRY